jgi:predicted Zn-dependent protease with MMP-like domain
MKPGRQHLLKRLELAALEEIDRVLKALPRPLRQKAQALPISLEPVPGSDLVKDGLEPDTLGLFVGDPYADALHASDNVPAQILLFLENIWEYAQRDTAAYREEVRVTYMHELGHYLGLDEDDLFIRELD